MSFPCKIHHGDAETAKPAQRKTEIKTLWELCKVLANLLRAQLANRVAVLSDVRIDLVAA